MDINVLIVQDEDESKESFAYRKNVTLKLAEAGWSLNPMTCIVLSRCYINRQRYSNKYDDGVEVLLDQIDQLLK